MAVLNLKDNGDESEIMGGSSGGAFVGGQPGGQGATTRLSPGNATAPTHSGSYTNLNQYLQANQGADGTAGTSLAATGQGVENVLNNAASAANQAQGAYQQSASNDINAGGQSAQVNQGFLNSINQGAGQYKSGSTTPATYTGPNTGNAVYGGPQDLGGFGGQTAQNQATAGQATNAATGMGQKAASGRFADLSSVLKNTFAQPQYSAGENSLDAFIVGGNQGTNNAVNQGAANANATQGNYNNINNALQGQITGYQNQAADTNNQYQKAINDARYQTAHVNDMYGNDAVARNNALTDLSNRTNQANLTNNTNLTNKTNNTNLTNLTKLTDLTNATNAYNAPRPGNAPPPNVSQGKASTPFSKISDYLSNVSAKAGNYVSGAANNTVGGKIVNAAFTGVPGAVGSVLQGQNPVSKDTVLGQTVNAGSQAINTVKNKVTSPIIKAVSPVTSPIIKAVSPVTQPIAAAQQNTQDVLTGKKKLWS